MRSGQRVHMMLPHRREYGDFTVPVSAIQACHLWVQALIGVACDVPMAQIHHLLQ